MQRQRIEGSGVPLYLTADETELGLQAAIAGYFNREPENKQPATVIWRLEGSGSLEHAAMTDNDLGVFFNTLSMPKTAGSRATVYARLDSDSSTGEGAK